MQVFRRGAIQRIASGLGADEAIGARPEPRFLFRLSWARFSNFVLPLLVVLTLASFDGGYWPAAWGWGGLALAWTAMLALVLRRSPRLGRLDLAFVSSLALVVGWVLFSTLWSASSVRSVLEGQRALLYLAGVTGFSSWGEPGSTAASSSASGRRSRSRPDMRWQRGSSRESSSLPT